MATYYRRDDEVQNGLGQPLPNIAVTYYTQPGLTLATVYGDSAGATPATNPQLTDGLGQAYAYLAAGTYTITYSGAQIKTLTYPDQNVAVAASSSATAPVVPTPAPNGVVLAFTLPFAPTNPAANMLFVSGSLAAYSVAYTVTGTTINWIGAVPPQTGDLLEYFTQ